MGPIGIPELIILLVLVGLPALLIFGIVRLSTARRCPQCGKRVKAGRLECPSCGLDFRLPERPA